MSENILTQNELTPLIFEQYTDAERAAKKKCGLCLGHLNIHAQGESWAVICPVCGPAYAHTVISAAQAERAASDRTVSMRELRPESESTEPFDEAAALKALGF